ncbi:MltA domain-containing protein [Leptolyngbya sp. FACHB-16]|uniref:murein transglycosylase A n=1 Tax=unclassified Leptolyngbya TaxID=2650499 RepID=UPI001F54D243|nr:MltA domain-containing protein [Leptolyngbya sp. FACHB-16]
MNPISQWDRDWLQAQKRPSGRLPLAIAVGATLIGTLLTGLPAAWAQETPAESAPATTAEAPLRRLGPADVVDRQTRYALLRDNRLWQDRAALLQAIDRSLAYLSTPAAQEAYTQYGMPEFTRDRVRRSLTRFRQLLRTSNSLESFQTAILNEFELYQSIGRDGEGTVDFTGYFEPIYPASRVRTVEFRYPLYREPANLAQWPQPHPTRLELEGIDGLQGSQGRLRGLELVWLRNRLDAYLIQVQGSARLQLANNGIMTVGYAGRTEHPYVSLGRELINDGKVPAEGLTLPVVIDYFRQHPDELNEYISRNNRFIFFQETAGHPPLGSLNVPVTSERSIATDKTVMPPGALALIYTNLPYPDRDGRLFSQRVSRFVLDQDTGGAIQGPGRVDIFMGTGPVAGDRAGLVNNPGELYYLLLREP